MAPYQIARSAALAVVLLAGCRKHGSPPIRPDAAPASEPMPGSDAAPAADPGNDAGSQGDLPIQELWLHAHHVMGEAGRFRAGQELALGFTTRVPASGAAAQLHARVSLRDATGKVRFSAGDLASTSVGQGATSARVEAAVAFKLPPDLAACACSAVLELTDAAGRHGQAELPMTVVDHVAGPPPAVTGVITGVSARDGDGAALPFLLPGDQAELVLTRKTPPGPPGAPRGGSQRGEKLEVSYLGPPPEGADPTAALEPARTLEASRTHLPFAVPLSAAPVYAAVIRDLDARGQELGSARIRLPVALPDDERDYLSGLRVAKLGVYGGTLGHTALAGILPAGQPLQVSVSVGGYHVVGRRSADKTEYAIGVTVAVRLRDHGGQLVDAKEDLVSQKGAIVVAPPRLRLSGSYTIPASFHGRGTLEVEAEDLVKHEVSSVFREIEVP